MWFSCNPRVLSTKRESPLVSIEDFAKLQLKVAVVVEAKAHPDADKLLVLTVDTGGEKKEIVAGIARHYSPAELVGKRVVVVDNLQPATLRGVTSYGMLLAAQDAEVLSLVTPERAVAPGASVR